MLGTAITTPSGQPPGPRPTSPVHAPRPVASLRDVAGVDGDAVPLGLGCTGAEGVTAPVGDGVPERVASGERTLSADGDACPVPVAAPEADADALSEGDAVAEAGDRLPPPPDALLVGVWVGVKEGDCDATRLDGRRPCVGVGADACVGVGAGVGMVQGAVWSSTTTHAVSMTVPLSAATNSHCRRSSVAVMRANPCITITRSLHGCGLPGSWLGHSCAPPVPTMK
jgi:hypothetical protein